MKNLRQVFYLLRNFRIKLQLDEYNFIRNDVELLGHVVTPNGIKPNPMNVDAINKFHNIKTYKNV